MNERSLHFLIPGDLQAATGGYGYDRRIIAGLRTLGWRVLPHALDASFPHPTVGALERANALLAALPDEALVLVDGLALGAMPQVVAPHAERLRLIALVHHPLAAETGLPAGRALELAYAEQQALKSVRRVIVTSDATRHALGAYGVESSRISVVEPGTDAAPLARRARTDTLRMLCVATVTPRKGHDLLFEALAPLTGSWQLTCVGSLTSSVSTVTALRSQLQGLGLDRQVLLRGEVAPDALGRCYTEADLFVLATRFEGYGMAVAEALAHGLPVISTRVGAIAALVGASAGLIVAPENPGELRAALRRVLHEPGVLTALAQGAAAVRSALPRWQDSYALMSQALEEVSVCAGQC